MKHARAHQAVNQDTEPATNAPSHPTGTPHSDAAARTTTGTRATQQRVSRRARQRAGGQAGEHQRRAQLHQQGKPQACGLGRGLQCGFTGIGSMLKPAGGEGRKLRGSQPVGCEPPPRGGGQGGGGLERHRQSERKKAAGPPLRREASRKRERGPTAPARGVGRYGGTRPSVCVGGWYRQDEKGPRGKVKRDP